MGRSQDKTDSNARERVMSTALAKAPTASIAITQVIVTALGAAAALLLSGPVAAWSILLGGLLSLVPNAWFASMMFRHGGARAAAAVVRSAYLGELIKLVLVGAGFALVLAVVDPLHIPALFGGFVFVHLAGLAAVIRHAGTGIGQV